MRRLPLGLILVLAGGALAAGPHAQNLQRSGEASAATGLLMGVIVDPLDGQPVANAEVTLGGAPPTVKNSHVFTDAEGRFVFLNLPNGVYSITATKPGFAEGAYGRLRPAGRPQALTLADKERIGDLRIAVWKLAAITGRITDEAGEPMVAIAVRALQRTVVAGKFKLVPGPTARTDDRGVYRLASLTPGDYAVVVPSTQTSLPDSVIDLYRQRRVRPLKPGESDVIRDLGFSAATAALNLNIFERYAGARAGGVAFLSIGGGSLPGVAPMPSGDGRIHVYPTRYYPAAAVSAGASTIALRSGDERAGVDVQLAPAATSRVSGTVTGPDGPLMAALSLVPDSDDLSTDASLETATTLSDAAGRFTFVGVPEGRHQLRAIWVRVPVGGGSRGAPPPPPPGGGAPPAPLPTLGGFTLWATQTITVGESDVDELAVTVRAGFRIGGRAEFAGAAAQPPAEALRRMSATFDPADARPLVSTIIGRGQFDDKGRLSSYQLPPGRYSVRINNPPPGWTLKSAVVNGRDVSNVPLTLDRDVTGLVVTFTDRPASLAGQVHTASGDPDAAATVLVFPVDPGAWTDYGDFPRRLRAERVDRHGQYRISGLPAGDYRVVAIAEESSANWQDPRVLRVLAGPATSIALADGESRSVSLKTSAVAR
jgi:hypothetical protein